MSPRALPRPCTVLARDEYSFVLEGRMAPRRRRCRGGAGRPCSGRAMAHVLELGMSPAGS
jgi:hypothetical protein